MYYEHLMPRMAGPHCIRWIRLQVGRGKGGGRVGERRGNGRHPEDAIPRCIFLTTCLWVGLRFDGSWPLRLPGSRSDERGGELLVQGGEVFDAVPVVGERLGPVTAVHRTVQLLMRLEQRRGHRQRGDRKS